ncbi:hypothetical protein OROMI_032293 [Orobanche minor]
MAEVHIQIEVGESRFPHEITPLLKNPEEAQEANNPDEQQEEEDDHETHLDKTLERLYFFLSFLGFNQSSIWSFLVSWGVFLVIGVWLPLVMLELSNCPGCEKGQIKSFEIGIVISQACLAAASLVCLSHNLRKYGVRKFLFVDRYSGHIERLSSQYVHKISDSMRILVTWVIGGCLLKTAREIIRIIYVRHEGWWQSVLILLGLVFSWTYVTTVILSACVLFHVVCTLQIIHFEDYGKLLQREADVVVLLQEHARLRFYLSKISHRFRIYLLLQFVIVTISQFMTLFQTTGYNGMITVINGGDFAKFSTYLNDLPSRADSESALEFLEYPNDLFRRADSESALEFSNGKCSVAMEHLVVLENSLVSSIVQVVGIILCLNAAAKISHRAQGIGALASRWHALMTCNATDASPLRTSNSIGNSGAAKKSDSGSDSGSGLSHTDYWESDLESLDFVTAPTNVQLASYMSSYHKRLALANPGGITIFGWTVDRGLINTIFFIQLSLVTFVLGKTVIDTDTS